MGISALFFVGITKTGILPNIYENGNKILSSSSSSSSFASSSSKIKRPMIPNATIPLRTEPRFVIPKQYYEEEYKDDFIINALKNKSIDEYTKSELTQIENLYLLHAKDKKIFSHFYVHIPKVAG